MATEVRPGAASASRRLSVNGIEASSAPCASRRRPDSRRTAGSGEQPGERRARGRGQGRDEPVDRLLPAITHEGHHRPALGAEPALEVLRRRGRVGELALGDSGEPRAVGGALDEADEQGQELPAVVLLLPPLVALLVEGEDARRDVGDHVAQVGVAAEAARQAHGRQVGGGHQGGAGPEAEAGDRDRPVPEPGQVAHAGADVLHLVAAQPERGQPLQLRDQDLLARAGEEPGQAHQLGMAPPVPRQAMHEQDAPARGPARGPVEVGLEPSTLDRQGDALAHGLPADPCEPAVQARCRQRHREGEGRPETQEQPQREDARSQREEPESAAATDPSLLRASPLSQPDGGSAPGNGTCTP